MIKILEKGTLRIPKEKTCHYCGCYFSFEDQDIEKNVLVNTLAPRPFAITCPQCNHKIELSEEYEKGV